LAACILFSSDLFLPNRNAFSYLNIILPIGLGPTEDLKQLGETATISARFWPLNPHYKDLIPWRLLEETVPDKILLGSDYPCGQTPKEAVEAVQNLPISEDFKRKILGENATRLLGL